MHRNSMLIKIQPNATVCRYLFTTKLLYIFRVSQHASSGVLKIVTAASGTGHTVKYRINWNEQAVCVGLLTSGSNGWWYINIFTKV